MSKELDQIRYRILRDSICPPGCPEDRTRCPKNTDLIWSEIMCGHSEDSILGGPNQMKNFIGTSLHVADFAMITVTLESKCSSGTLTNAYRFHLCKDTCLPAYISLFKLAVLEMQYLQTSETAKTMKLLGDKMERENVERAMAALGKDIADDKKESGEPRGLE